MKKTLLILVSLVCAVTVFGQGTMAFNNRIVGSVVAPIYGVDPANQGPSGFRQGNTSAGTPPGTQLYSGVPLLSGTGYTAQLFGGAVGTSLDPASPANALTPTVAFRTGSAAGYTVTPAPTVAVPGVAENGTAVVQLRAWDNRGGTITSWDQVLQDPSVPRGWSTTFNVSPLGGTLTTPPNLVGLTSFNLFIVPEPSVIALGVLGVGALLLFRRRKN